MNRAAWVLFLVGSVMAGSPAIAAADESPPTRDRSAIEAVLLEQEKAWNKGDLDAFFEGYWRSEQVTYAGSEGVARGWDAVLARFKKRYPDRKTMGRLKFSGLQVRALDTDAALVLGRWHLTRESGNVGGVFSVVFRRFPEGWKIVHDHTSVVPAAAAAGS